MDGSWNPWDPLNSVEDRFNYTSAVHFMRGVWYYSFYFSAFYVVTIFAIQRYMLNRPRYTLRRPLMIWSLMLALFSFFGFWTAGLHHWGYLLKHGWYRSVCDPVLVEKQFGLWAFLFCFSKCPELVDTYFIVLRKQKLIFLHWYHHITVMVYCWFSYSYITHPQQWFISMNYFVHFIMYSYYAVRASSFYRPPVWVNMIITSLQLLQMVIGVWINVYLYFNMKFTPDFYCDGEIETTNTYVFSAFAMYASYFVLFTQFFYSAYIKKSHSRKPPLKSPHCNGVTGRGTSFQLTNGTLLNKTKTLLKNGLRHRS